MTSAVGVRVLGPLEVVTTAGPAPLGGSLRTLLAALAVDAGRVVAADTLAERLWEDGGLDAGASTVHSYVSRLRRRLEPQRPPSGWQVLQTRAPGYRLVLEEGALDAEEFRRLLTLARGRTDPAAARDDVARALSLWRGPAYADVPGDFARAEAARLHEQRLEAEELAAELDLALGRHRQVAGRLPALVAAEPFREGLRAALVLALYRADRQADALRCYEEGRRLLADALGVDPGPQLRRLHELLLRQDPELDAPAPATAVAGAAAAPPSTEPSTGSPTGSPTGRSTAPASRRPALPTPPTALLGRTDDLARLHRLLDDGARLVTLTGTGGVGKTRLALALAAAREAGDRAAARFADGAVLVPLATLDDAADVVPAVARALGVGAVEGPGARDAVAAHLHPLHLLLVLDNFEHLLDAAVDVAELVRTCPHLVVVVTSRAPLRVAGEVEHRVEPLALPPAGAGADEVLSSAAVTLFCDRARDVVPGFRLGEDEVRVVADVCTALAGIPLALELAAARVRVLGPRDLLARLDEALSGGRRDLPERQRTMQATLDWSYGLLDAPARGLFRRLGVFSGSWTLPVLEAVEGPAVLPLLEALVEQSLVRVEHGEDGARFSMLEPTRQHAQRLLGDTERAQAQAAHAAAHLALAEEAYGGYQRDAQVGWLRRIERAHADLLAAVDAACAAGDGETAGRLVWAMWLFWWMHGHLAVGRRACAAVQRLPGLPDRVRVRVDLALGAMLFAQGEHEHAEEVWDRARRLAVATGDDEALAHTAAGTGITALARGDAATAVERLRAALGLAAALPAGSDGPWLEALGHVWTGTALTALGRDGGEGAAGAGGRAREHFETGLALARRRGDRLTTFVALYNLAQAEAPHDAPAAERRLHEGIELSAQIGDLANLSHFLDALVVLGAAGVDRDPERLAVLLGAARAARDTVGADVYGFYLRDDAQLEAARSRLRHRLGGQRFAEALAAGHALPVEAVVRLAVHGPGTLTAPAAPATPPS
ncbi:AfsR/SARP family transcriptional regulator [Kineococcus esterisolvens]|uniref:AfsR/SARP family transcriptional regulator n=1 Tax=unclassified Kineococcus TaxID=2621656 RepID=UPI003D7C6A90